MNLQESELILNADGSIYHLHLRPEHLAPVVITVGDPDRVAKVSRYFDRMDYRRRKREFVTHTGWVGKVRLSVVSTGIGPDNIDIVLNELDALVNIDLETRLPKAETTALTIIRLGTTGGLQPDLPVDTLVASDGGLGLDGLLQFYLAPEQHGHALVDALRGHCADAWSFPVAPYFAEADTGLLERLGGSFQRGITATNPGFYAPQGRRLRAPLRQPAYLELLTSFEFDGRRIVNLEMETAAIYGLSALLGHRALSLSVVLANRTAGTFSRRPERAVRRLIESTLEKISEGF
jgi:uridine phosphorylase